MGRTIGITVAVLIWMAVLLAARGLVLGADDPIDAVRYQGMQLLSHWFGVVSGAPGGEMSLSPAGVQGDTGEFLHTVVAGLW